MLCLSKRVSLGQISTRFRLKTKSQDEFIVNFQLLIKRKENFTIFFVRIVTIVITVLELFTQNIITKKPDIRITLFGEQHKDVVQSYYNIGGLQSNLGLLDSALCYVQKALSIFQKEQLGSVIPM